MPILPRRKEGGFCRSRIGLLADTPTYILVRGLLFGALDVVQ
jgi:hypothetical protein